MRIKMNKILMRIIQIIMLAFSFHSFYIFLFFSIFIMKSLLAFKESLNTYSIANGIVTGIFEFNQEFPHLNSFSSNHHPHSNLDRRKGKGRNNHESSFGNINNRIS